MFLQRWFCIRRLHKCLSLLTLQAENARLIALLESEGIEWRLPLKPAPRVQEAESSRLSTGDKAALIRR